MKRYQVKQYCIYISLALCLVLPAVAAGQQSVADMQISTGQTTWKTHVNASGWTLSVSGQGIYLREEYENANDIRLSPMGPDGERLPDGSYNWELRAINPGGQQKARSRSKERKATRTETERGSFERREKVRPVVTSGSFQIQGGGFVMPQPEQGEAGDQ